MFCGMRPGPSTHSCAMSLLSYADGEVETENGKASHLLYRDAVGSRSW